MLSNDAWMQIGLHLNPRHLAKLMCTSKTIKKIVDNDAYWTRVAAHLVCRESMIMEMYRPSALYHAYDVCDRLPYIDHNLYHMIGLEHGYYWSMERFFQRIDECIDYYSNSSDADDFKHKQWCMVLKPMTLSERTREVMRVQILEPNILSLRRNTDELLLSMKEIAKRDTEKSMRVRFPHGNTERAAMYNAFVRDMEDAQIPSSHKRYMFQALHVLLMKATITYRGVFDIDEFIVGICKF
jgi:hypothetical protein